MKTSEALRRINKYENDRRVLLEHELNVVAAGIPDLITERNVIKRELKMDYTIMKFGEVTEDTMHEIVSVIDCRCFPDEQHDPDYELALYRINKHALCVVHHDGKIIGYIEMLPLTEIACVELAQGVFDVEMFKPEHIAKYNQGLTNITLYIRTLAVLPGNGEMTVFKRLISEAAAFAVKLTDEGIKVDEFVAYFTNEKVEKILVRRGFVHKYASKNGLPIYSLPFEHIHKIIRGLECGHTKRYHK